MPSDLPYRDLDDASAPYNWGRETANAARGAVCALWRDYAGAFLGNPIPFGEPIRQFNQGFWNTVCPPDSYPHPDPDEGKFSGGQCVTQYRVSTTATLHINSPPSDEVTTRTDVLTGPINGLVETQTPDGQQVISISYTKPDGTTDLFNVYGVYLSAGRFTSYSITGIVRVDGLLDNCGDSQPHPIIRPIPDSRRRNVPVPVPLPNGSLITVVINEIEIDNTFNIPVNVKMNNNFNIKFDLGGAKFDFPNGVGGGGTVDLTPVLNATTQIQRDLVDLSGTAQDIYDSRLRFIDNNVPIVSCGDDGIVEQQVTIKVLSDGLNSETLLTDTLFSQIYRLLSEGKVDCIPDRAVELVLAATTIEDDSVTYTSLRQPPSLGYLLQIDELDIRKLRTYKLSGDDSEYGLGNVSIVSSNNAVVGDAIRVFTTKTFVNATNISFPHRVRISLKPGIRYKVYDLGYAK